MNGGGRHALVPKHLRGENPPRPPADSAQSVTPAARRAPGSIDSGAGPIYPGVLVKKWFVRRRKRRENVLRGTTDGRPGAAICRVVARRPPRLSPGTGRRDRKSGG